MNQKRRRRTVRLSKGGIEQLEQAKDKGRDHEGKPLTFESIAEKAKVSDKTVKRFFRGEAVDPGYADAIIEALGLRKEEVLSSEESLVVESIERIEARSAELERHETHSDRAGELIEELERKLKELKQSTDDWNLIDQAIQETVIPLNLEPKFYVKALIFIKDQRVLQELPPEVAKELTLCLDYLIKIIPIRF
jgi:hypothetical protein